MKKVYILLKTHKKTGLQYLCRHVTKDEKTCYSYNGSGTYWRKHLEKHGYDLETEILAKCETIEEAKTIGIMYSDKWDVVSNPNFANLVREEGQGGAEVANKRKAHGSRFGYEQKPVVLVGDDNPSKRKEVREKISQKLKGREITWRDKLSEARMGIEPWNKGKANPHARTDHMNIKIECPHCHKTGLKGAMTRWHFDNCKLKEIYEI